MENRNGKIGLPVIIKFFTIQGRNTQNATPQNIIKFLVRYELLRPVAEVKMLPAPTASVRNKNKKVIAKYFVPRAKPVKMPHKINQFFLFFSWNKYQLIKANTAKNINKDSPKSL
ncbi:MAG: hypothetical protein PHW62_05295 [Candidatus Ratteibacteria bacterium]|nr:hypothetical protein [Candidatus Ratteibacteria bacterium]